MIHQCKLQRSEKPDQVAIPSLLVIWSAVSDGCVLTRRNSIDVVPAWVILPSLDMFCAGLKTAGFGKEPTSVSNGRVARSEMFFKCKPATCLISDRSWTPASEVVHRRDHRLPGQQAPQHADHHCRNKEAMSCCAALQKISHH